MRRQLVAALVVFLAFTVLTGLAYPLVVTGVARLGWSDEADGSLVQRGGVVVGSALIGQSFTEPGYFHPRPSAAGAGYDGAASGGTNLGPTNGCLVGPITACADPDRTVPIVEERAAAYRIENELAAGVAVPNDAVTASSSGLDPHISLANARLQAARVATARRLPLAEVLELVDAHLDGAPLGFLGEAGVNVLTLNLALDERAPVD